MQAVFKTNIETIRGADALRERLSLVKSWDAKGDKIENLLCGCDVVQTV